MNPSPAWGEHSAARCRGAILFVAAHVARWVCSMRSLRLYILIEVDAESAQESVEFLRNWVGYVPFPSTLREECHAFVAPPPCRHEGTSIC